MRLEERKFIKALADKVKAGHPLTPGEMSKALELLITQVLLDLADDE